MKGLVCLFGLLFLFSSAIIAQNYGLGNAPLKLFGDYKIPDTKVFSYALGGDFSLHSNNYNDYSVNTDHYENTNLSASLFPNFFYTDESDNSIFKISARLEGKYRRQTLETDNQPQNLTDTKSLYLLSNINFRNYINTEGSIFLQTSADAYVLLLENGGKSNQSNNNYYIKNNSKTQIYNISAGIGWGRLRNVTPVVSAIRFQERMKQLNIITEDLSNEEINSLAEQFSRYDYNTSVHNRAQKYFWENLFSALHRSGISTSEINEYALNYLQEVPTENRFIRYEGSYAGLDATLRYSSSYGFANSFEVSNQPYSWTSRAEQSTLLLGIYYSYSHQLNLDSQLGISVVLNGGPGLSELYTVKQEYNAALNLKYDFELTDRLVVSLNNQLNYTIQNLGYTSKALANILSADLYYFIEDNINISLDYEYYFHDSRNNRYPGKPQQNDHLLNLGFNYYFDRGILF